MLSSTTIQILTELFLNSSKIEKQVEIIRQLLCEFPSFHPYNIFKKLDQINQNHKMSVDVNDICSFMEKNGFFHSIDECRVFIQNYDQDNDGTLQYSEFLRAILPNEQAGLRQSITIKPPKDEELDPEVQYILAKLISTEILLTVDSDLLKKDLLQSQDFNISQFLQFISKRKVICASDLNEFFRKQSILIYQDELDSIIKRIDFNRDNLIDEYDLERYLQLSKRQKPIQIKFPSHRKNLTTQISSSKLMKTPEKNYISKGDDTMSNILTQSKVNFNTKLTLNMSQSPSKIKTPIKYLQQKADLRAELATVKLSAKKSSDRKLIRNKSQEKSLNRSLNMSKNTLTDPSQFIGEILINIIENEAKLEILKIQLAKQPEFNLFDAFRAIDVDKLGYVTCNDLEYFLNISTSMKNFLNKHGSNGKIRFSEFVKLISPYSIEYQKYLQEKKPISDSLAIPIDQIFDLETLRSFKDLLYAIYESDQQLFSLKRKIESQISLKEAFQLISQKHNSILFEDIEKFFINNRVTVREINLLISKLDQDGDGSISLNDFLTTFQ